MQPVCLQCAKEMVCTKTGFTIAVNVNHFYSGDKFTCPKCNQSVVTGFGGSFTSQKITNQNADLDMSPPICRFSNLSGPE